MVSTRQMRKRKTAADEESPEAGTQPPSSLPDAASPKRQRKLPVREKGSEKQSKAPAKSSLVVEIKAKSTRKGSDLDTEELDETTIIPGADQPAPDPEVEEAGNESDELKSAGGASDSENGVEVEDGSLNSQSPNVQKTTIVPSISEPSDDDDEASDSDDAPEAVSTTKAAAKVIQSVKAANRAIAEQAQAEKRKRKERTTRLQAQAQGRKSHLPGTPGDKSELEQDEITPRTQLVLETDAAATRKQLFDAQNPLPSVLPMEYLDSDADEPDAESETEALGKQPPRKARKITTAERKIAREVKSGLPRDTVVGSTVYRAAAKKQDERLAPRGGKQSANAKKALMVRGRKGTTAKKGFFVK